MLKFNIKQFREDKGLTQVQLAEVLSCKQSFISSIEKGERQLSSDKMDILSEKYGDLSDYIAYIPDEQKTIVQKNHNGDNIGGDKILFSSPEEKDAEIIRLHAKLEAAQNEIAWLRSMVEKLTAK